MAIPKQPVEDEIIYDWNVLDIKAPAIDGSIELFDETLRDGIQSPSVTDPTPEDKLELIHLMDNLGISAADIGLPAAGKRAQEDTLMVAQEIVRAKLKILPAAAGRTLVSDIEPIAEISQKAGIPIEVYAFIGSSPIRQFAENWDLDRMLKTSADAIDFAVKEGLPFTYVTEDTIRSHPATLDRMFRNAIDHGATALCLCDTVGHATPDGVRRLIHWTRDLIRGIGAEVRIDWHGHNDRGLGVVNSLFALEYGARRVHGAGLGVGERVGNAAIDQILLNLKLLGSIDNDLSDLLLYCQAVSRACRVPIPYNYPLAGTDAFRTATGVHAAAIIKAEAKGDAWLADRIYSGVPASEFGKVQEIEVGHQSGVSNVRYWLKSRRLPHDDESLVDAIYKRAKSGNRTLTEDEIFAVIRQHGAKA
jgi:2-isopropylmalate synthase